MFAAFSFSSLAVHSLAFSSPLIRHTFFVSRFAQIIKEFLEFPRRTQEWDLGLVFCGNSSRIACESRINYKRIEWHNWRIDRRAAVSQMIETCVFNERIDCDYPETIPFAETENKWNRIGSKLKRARRPIINIDFCCVADISDSSVLFTPFYDSILSRIVHSPLTLSPHSNLFRARFRLVFSVWEREGSLYIIKLEPLCSRSIVNAISASR